MQTHSLSTDVEILTHLLWSFTEQAEAPISICSLLLGERTIIAPSNGLPMFCCVSMCHVEDNFYGQTVVDDRGDKSATILPDITTTWPRLEGTVRFDGRESKSIWSYPYACYDLIHHV